MLAVQKNYRGHGIAKQLITRAVDALKLKGADEIVLETEVTNTIAMRLYENMGFLRSKRLNRYYLNGNDAFRLILPITEQSTILSQFLMLQQQQQLQQLQDVQSQEQLVPSFESHHII
jgi:peptide alpha-N-acetyltransferase